MRVYELSPSGIERQKRKRSRRAQLKILDDLKDGLIQQVSHDLRNPMAAINMYVEYLLKGDADRDKILPRHREMLSVVMDNAKRLNVFVSNILDAAKIKAGRMEYHVKAVQLQEVANDVIVLFKIVAKQNEIVLQSDVPASLPPVRADPEHLEQVLANLVANALKFTRVGGQVRINAQSSDGKIRIMVSDTGLGISKDQLSKLFVSFSQADVARQRAQGIHGTGLGLFIVKQTVEGMGGKVWIESEEGKGTRVCLELAQG